ncbi:disulfide bond formation protein B [Magnetospirillum sp. 64-120]|uniref:disulfide bond formation protein B n=1 Tax=Magnetospirillum sp. 64-120 TaxID=1895778 RepID=UPI00092708DA|nr:disulfide bond formation protein B [Magnetospirillum sp. 64-120]OJX79937.1 MAG: disulfide bond formation protein [Magnetospirillum sp. 64-120]
MTGLDAPRANEAVWRLLFGAWLIALVSTFSVLFVGEILGQTPCVLCWYQRAFMFPLTVVLAVACYRSDGAVWRYALPLAAIGGTIALWHTLVFSGLAPTALEPCGAGPSCSSANMTILGGVPLPLLSVGAFGAIGILLQIVRKKTPQ